jgi:hypothetical protein
VASSNTNYTISGQYHGGMNMRGLGVGHPKGSTRWLKGGSLGRSPPGELPLGESLGCPPSGGWWLNPVGGTLNVIFVTYVSQMTIFGGAVLDFGYIFCPPYYYLIF